MMPERFRDTIRVLEEFLDGPVGEDILQDSRWCNGSRTAEEQRVLVRHSACIWLSRALTSRLPIFRTAAMTASCSALGRVVPASQL